MGEKSMSGRVGTQKSRCGDANSEVQETGNVAGARARAKELKLLRRRSRHSLGASAKWILPSERRQPRRDGGFSGSPLRPLRCWCAPKQLSSHASHASRCSRSRQRTGIVVIHARWLVRAEVGGCRASSRPAANNRRKSR
jgi:hypothetical protein